MFPWLIILLYLLSLRGTKSDEEDPLQRAAQIAARERQLTEILDLLQRASMKEKATINGTGSRGCQHTVLDLKIPNEYLRKFADGKLAILRLTNLLNNFFVNLPPSTNASEFDYSQTPHLFYALTREALEGENSLNSVCIAFIRGQFHNPSRDEMPSAWRETFAPYSYRRNSVIYTEDLASLYNYSYDKNEVEGTQWFTHSVYRVKQRTINLTKSQWEKNHFVLTNEQDGHWFSRPMLDCGASEQWVIAFSLPFFTSNGDGRTAKIRGVVLAMFPLKDVDINQCDDSGDILEKNVFGGTHKCDSVSTQCVPMSGFGFMRGGYTCKCRPSHYLPNEVLQQFNGTHIEYEFLQHKDKSYRFSCMACPEGCSECSGTQICQAQYDSITRLVPVCVQAAAVSICFILIVSIFKLRKCKVIATSLWTMLEVILFGAVVIYSTVFLRYVEPTVLMCLLEPWVRELGFALFYGAIVLKLYRTLVDHRTRKAHRYVIRDRDLLRYLSGLLVFMSCYLAAWAAFSGQLALEGHSILDRGRTLLGLNFYVCRSFWWDYVTEVGELLFVIFGLYLSWQLRGATRDTRDLNELQERRALAAALSLELLFSGTLYVSRHIVWLQAHPDHVFLAYFTRTHVTVSISLFLILIPKLWCIGGWKRRETSGRTFSTTDGTQELRLCEAIANGELESANLSQMDPEEIRAELRRVYTQLEELRSRTMRKDNPHISKRRGGRKPTHRRFSLQSRKGSKDKFHSKRHHHNHFDGIDDNKTPEESVCSIEGPSVLSVYADGPSTYSDLGTPSILHRSYKM